MYVCLYVHDAILQHTTILTLLSHCKKVTGLEGGVCVVACCQMNVL